MDMTVSWGLSNEQVYTELDRMEADIQASAQRQAEMIAAANLQIEAAATARRAEQMAASSALSQAFDADINRSIARSQQMAAQNPAWMEEANRSLTRSFTHVGNVGTAVFMGIGASIAIAKSGLDEYAKRNSQVAQDMERLGEAKDNLMADIGRGISPLVRDATSLVSATGSMLGGISDALADFYTGHMFGLGTPGESAADLAHAQKLIEIQDLEIKRRVEANRLDRQYRIETAEQEGRTVEAERLRGLQRREQAAMGFSKDMTVNDRQKVLDMIDEQTQKSMNLARMKLEQSKADEEEERRRARMQISDDERALSIQLQRLQGQKLEADLNELNMQANKRMAEIRDNKKLTPEEQRAAQAKLAEQFDAKRQLMIRQAQEDSDKEARNKEDLIAAQKSQLDLDLEMYDVSLMRMDGRRKEADLLELQLQTRRKIAEIEKSGLAPEEQQARIKRLQALSEREAGFIQNRSESLGQSRTTILDGGALNPATLERLVFNASGRENQADRIINLTKEQVTLLRRIAGAAEKDKLVVV